MRVEGFLLMFSGYVFLMLCIDYPFWPITWWPLTKPQLAGMGFVGAALLVAGALLATF